MPHENLNLAWADALWDELQESGVCDAVICPGSRSAPLAISAARRSGLRCLAVVDERSAAFLALGLGRARRVPAAMVCTSGTAGAHALPAVLEAEASGTPMVVITADRPWELQGFGAAQTCDQARLFGGHVRSEVQLPAPEPSAQAFRHLRAWVARATSAAPTTGSGPVHVNAAFREPLAPTADGSSAELLKALAAVGRTARVKATSNVDPAATDEVIEFLSGARRPLVALGPQTRWQSADLSRFLRGATARGIPIACDIASGGRFLELPRSAVRLSAYDLWLRSKCVHPEPPDRVLRLGAPFTSRTFEEWVQSAELGQVVGGERLSDPDHRLVRAWNSEPGTLVAALERARPGASWDGDWIDRLRQADARARHVARRVTSGRGLDGPSMAFAVADALGARGQLVVSNSTPIRDLDTFVAEAGTEVEVFANRGLNGIDGLIATATGIALADDGPTTLLMGDVAFAHDVGSLVAASRLEASLSIVVVNNGGGGIFDFLPISRFPELLEPLFRMPPGLDVEGAAEMARAEYRRVESTHQLGELLRQRRPGVRVFEACTPAGQQPAILREAVEHIERGTP